MLPTPYVFRCSLLHANFLNSSSSEMFVFSEHEVQGVINNARLVSRVTSGWVRSGWAVGLGSVSFLGIVGEDPPRPFGRHTYIANGMADPPIFLPQTLRKADPGPTPPCPKRRCGWGSVEIKKRGGFFCVIYERFRGSSRQFPFYDGY